MVTKCNVESHWTQEQKKHKWGKTQTQSVILLIMLSKNTSGFDKYNTNVITGGEDR